MSEAFDKLLAERKERAAAEARTQRLMMIAGAVVLVLVVLFLLWRGQDRPVNPNTASKAELQTLSEVGPEIAERIIRARPIKDAADMEKRVKGIGPRTLEKMKKQLDFDGDGKADAAP